MTIHIRQIPLLALLAYMLAASLSCACAADAPRPVAWYGDMRLGDTRPSQPAEWRALLGKRWEQDGRSVAFPVTDPAGKHVSVDSCSALFAVSTQKLRPQPQDAAIYDAWAIKCVAARMLSEAVPPRTDYLGEFSLDKSRVGALPTDLAFSVSLDDARRIKAIAERKGTLKDYLADASIEVGGSGFDRHVVIKDGDGGTQRLTLLARGDFDHDGIADVLIMASNQVSGGDYKASYLYVVSRLTADGPLQVRQKISAIQAAGGT